MKPSIVFVLLDGARWDRISVSPEFVDLQKEGTLFTNVTTATPYTVGAVNAIFTGLYGKDNGVDAYYKVLGLKDHVKTLSEVLQENGYYTACDLLHNKIISSRGFDVHQSHDEYKVDLKKRHYEFLKKCFEHASNKPLFCFLHFTRIHTITVSEVLNKFEWDDDEFYEKKDENLKRYDQVFIEAGTYAKAVKNAIDEFGKLQNTILIFFADHGTGVGERFGERNYGSFTYEETIRTFYLFIGYKIKKNQISDRLHNSLDIFPTIIELTSSKQLPNMPGKSLVEGLIKNVNKLEDDEFAFSETGALHGPFPSPEKPNVFCIKNSRYKLMYFKSLEQWKLYDLVNDPNEIKNVFGEGIQEELLMKEKLLLWIKR